jgi:hypothetical protein
VRRKIERLAKIERLTKRLHEVSAWRLARVQYERKKLSVAHAEMMEALGGDFIAYGPLSQVATRRVRTLESEMAVAHVVEKTLEQRTLDEGRQAKLANRVLAAAREDLRETTERRSLEELIEATLKHPSASRKSEA